MPERPLRIALLIDADNAPADLIDEILTELSTLGVINIRRAYGNWTKHALNGWQSRLLEFAIKPVQQFDYSRRKNATDMAMTIDALDLWYTEQPDAFGIVSSDADFTPLVMHLRAKGAAVYGFGAQQTPAPFVNACSRFLYLEALAREQAEADAQAATHVRLPASSDAKPTKAEKDSESSPCPHANAATRRARAAARAAREAAPGHLPDPPARRCRPRRAGRGRLGRRRRDRHPDHQQGLLRRPQLRLRQPHQTAHCHRPVRAARHRHTARRGATEELAGVRVNHAPTACTV